jgi:serine/threonine-protein kinase HipA
VPALELEVWLGPVHVGRLSQGSDYRTRFKFDPAYLELARRPVLGQWFEDRLEAGFFPGRGSSLPVYFDNLLPSENLQRLIRLQHDLEDPTDVELLACVGEDLPGCTIVRDPTRSAPVGFADGPALADHAGTEQLRLHFSLAGLQLKFSLINDGNRLTLPAGTSTGRVIAKVPTMHGWPGIVENEFTVMEWARAASFDVAHCEIRDASDLAGVPARVHGDKIFVVQRYDREAGRRIHQEDLAQVLGVASFDAVGSHLPFGYAAVCRVVREILGIEGAREFVRRLALIVATGNEDAHLKNWALVYLDGVTPTWSPLYDQVATVAWSGGAIGVTLDIGGVQRWEDIDQSAVDRFAAAALMPLHEVTSLFDATVERLRDAWSELERPRTFDPAHGAALVEHWERVPVLARHGPLRAGG